MILYNHFVDQRVASEFCPPPKDKDSFVLYWNFYIVSPHEVLEINVLSQIISIANRFFKQRAELTSTQNKIAERLKNSSREGSPYTLDESSFSSTIVVYPEDQKRWVKYQVSASAFTRMEHYFGVQISLTPYPQAPVDGSSWKTLWPEELLSPKFRFEKAPRPPKTVKALPDTDEEPQEMQQDLLPQMGPSRMPAGTPPPRGVQLPSKATAQIDLPQEFSLDS